MIAEAVQDPDLVERNRRLTARARRGDRFMIGGRITRSVGTLLLAGGIAMLVVHHVKDEDDPGLSIGGAVLTGIGAAAGITGGGLSFYGGREVAAARRGELPPDPAAPRGRRAARRGGRG